MNCMMNTKFILSIVLSVALFGCNKLIEVNPDAETVPEQSVAAIRSRFPEASDLTFKTLTKGRIWDASFKMSNSRYRSVVDRTNILTTYGPVNDSLKDSLIHVLYQLSVRWGAISNIRQILPDKESSPKTTSFLADYTWSGNIWTAKITFAEPGSGFYHGVSMFPQIDLEYVTTDLESLPDRAKEVLKEKSQWSGAVTVRLDKAGKRIYLAPFYRFDNEGVPYFAGLNHIVNYNSLEEISPNINDYFKHTTSFTEFKFSSGSKFKDSSCAGYSMYLSNDHDGVSEMFHFIFSESGGIVSETYTASVKP